jgi:DNA-binding HxlR family transcriptional regulator
MTLQRSALPRVRRCRRQSAPTLPRRRFPEADQRQYKLRIVWDLKDGPLRYSQIRSGLLRGLEDPQEIAPRVLSRELKALTESGLVHRRDYGVVRRK